jgi:hypothetical protein
VSSANQAAEVCAPRFARPSEEGESLGLFVQILTGSKMIAAFGDDETALVMYDTETVPVTSPPGAECVTVTDGKITYSRNVFDRVPLDAALRASS